MASLWTIELRHYLDDIEDVDTAQSREIFAADYGRANGNEGLAFLGVFGDFEMHGFDTHYYFGGAKRVSTLYEHPQKTICSAPTYDLLVYDRTYPLVEQLDASLFDLRKE